MKTYRWLTLLAALLITVSEVLIFNSEAAQVPPTQASVAAARTLRVTRTGTRLLRQSTHSTGRLQRHEVQSESVDVPRRQATRFLPSPRQHKRTV